MFVPYLYSCWFNEVGMWKQILFCTAIVQNVELEGAWYRTFMSQFWVYDGTVWTRRRYFCRHINYISLGNQYYEKNNLIWAMKMYSIQFFPASTVTDSPTSSQTGGKQPIRICLLKFFNVLKLCRTSWGRGSEQTENASQGKWVKMS